MVPKWPWFLVEVAVKASVDVATLAAATPVAVAGGKRPGRKPNKKRIGSLGKPD